MDVDTCSVGDVRKMPGSAVRSSVDNDYNPREKFFETKTNKKWFVNHKRFKLDES